MNAWKKIPKLPPSPPSPNSPESPPLLLPNLNIRINPAPAPAPPAACSIPEATLRAYAALIGYEGPDPLAKATEIISELDQEKSSPGYFTALCDTLPTKILLPSTVAGLEGTHNNIFRTTNHKTANGARLNTIEKKKSGSGSFSTVYKSVNGHVYKFITNEVPAELEKKMRGIFLEAFIQLVLAMDPVKGSSVCRIQGMYRTPTIPIQIPIYRHTVVIQLEYITDTLFNKLVPGLTFPDLALMMKSIHETLMYFREKYNFHHRDLHSGNIMLNDANELKLIDFGESCITYCGKTFSLRRNGLIQNCESADMLILVGSMYEYSGLNDAVKEKLLDLLGKMRVDYDAINELIKSGMLLHNAKLTIGFSSIFHKFYHYELSTSLVGQAFLKDYDNEFLVKLEALKGGYRKRRNTKRYRQKHRKTIRRRLQQKVL